MLIEVRSFIKNRTGIARRGWTAPWMSQSRITPDLLHEAGYSFEILKV